MKKDYSKLKHFFPEIYEVFFKQVDERPGYASFMEARRKLKAKALLTNEESKRKLIGK